MITFKIPWSGSGAGGGAAAAAAAAAALPSRPCRRMVLILSLWTCVCYVVFRLGSLDGVPTVPLAAPDDASSASSFSSFGGVNTRELLQKVAETRGPNPFFPSPSPSSSSFSYSNEVLGTTEVNPLEAEPAIDRSPKKQERDLVEELQGKLPNLPLVYLHENKGKDWHLRDNKTCAKFPRLFDLHISNLYWQETETSNGTFYLYGAYLDRRRQNRLGPTVRILGMINRIEPKVKTFCQIWFSGQKEPVISKVLEYKYIWFRKWGNYKQGIFQPYMLACQLPSSHWRQVPVSVSVVEGACDTATNNLRVTYNVLRPGEPKKKFGVCVKGLDFPTEDLSVRLAEWIEVLSALGADTIFLYDLGVHPNVTKVLRHYTREGKVDLTPLTLPGYMPNMRGLQHLYLKNMLNYKRQNEVVPYNDCLYRNIYRFQYLALLDVDEVIMPKRSRGWAEMMEKEVVPAALKIKNVTRASYNFRNVYFMDEMLRAHRPDSEGGPLFKDIPPYLHMMQHVYRSANYTKPGQYIKCFHDPGRVLILHNHFPLGCLGGVCTSYPVDTDVGHLQHYRADCVNTLKKSCADTYKNVSVLDDSIWRYKEEVVAKTTDVLSRLGFFKRPMEGTTPTTREEVAEEVEEEEGEEAEAVPNQNSFPRKRASPPSPPQESRAAGSLRVP